MKGNHRISTTGNGSHEDDGPGIAPHAGRRVQAGAESPMHDDTRAETRAAATRMDAHRRRQEIRNIVMTTTLPKRHLSSRGRTVHLIRAKA
ncbi:hypothetical protein FHS82_001540 [Pseudochelatococcus lubricantis]|uniref:Uncharacterized protein n=1 Tax=Pseudochelatococcus lubricantis TaxID=1538102 RepID=A0ABX0UZI3_9HYPH|nr:hypothetical protein [Pseudochelatococcus lubricantis]NIJ57704.1 hypothetical protein [Pseudochelatococcus lubricantis]